jgi:hypothetical protein
MRYSLLITPLARAAFFDDYINVATCEVEELTGVRPILKEIGTLKLLELDYDGPPSTLARLATIDGVFESVGETLRPIDVTAEFQLPRSLVYGAKYPGKTNETLTQLALNLALHFAEGSDVHEHSLLDPMAGRGTTLLWATRYGIEADGLEADGKALVDFQREVKKCTKLDRIKHKQETGQLPHLKKASDARFTSFTFQGAKARLIHGDSREPFKYLGQKKRYSLLVSDLPYGVQHFAGKDRNPLATLNDAAPHWAKLLKPGGSMVLVFNAFIPKRDEIIEVFSKRGLKLQAPTYAHRVSESIKRELVIFTKS